MGHGSRHRRPAQGRRHERTQDGRQVAPTTSPRRSGSRAARFLGATVALSLGAGVTAVMAGAADSGSAPTSLKVSADADTYVYQEYPGENRGAATKLTASNQAKLHTRSYLKFTVEGVPAGVTPKAHLLLSSDRNQPGAVELHAVADTSWNAMSMTMRNAPSVGGLVATAKPAARQRSLDFDLTGVVKGNGSYSFAMVAPEAGTVSAVFASEHGADGPALALDWSGSAGKPAPAPSSAAPTQPAPSVDVAAAAVAEQPDQAHVDQQLVGTGAGARRRVTRPPAARCSAPACGPVTAPTPPRRWPGRAARSAVPTSSGPTTRACPRPGPARPGRSGGPVVVSFKAQPKDVVSGRLDGQFANWFNSAPKDRPIFWSYFHEPENDVESGSFTTADYRAAWVHLSGLADRANNPQLRSNLILMCWTLQSGSHRNWQDYFAGASVIDTIGWDCYNKSFSKGSYGDPASMLGKAVATSKGAGVNWAVAELGSKMAAGDSGTGRAAWLTAIGSYARVQRRRLHHVLRLDRRRRLPSPRQPEQERVAPGDRRLAPAQDARPRVITRGLAFVRSDAAPAGVEFPHHPLGGDGLGRHRQREHGPRLGRPQPRRPRRPPQRRAAVPLGRLGERDLAGQPGRADLLVGRSPGRSPAAAAAPRRPSPSDR